MNIDKAFEDQEILVSKVRLSSVPSKAEIWIWKVDSAEDTEDGFGSEQDVFTGFLTPSIVPVYMGDGTRHFRLKKDGYEDVIVKVEVEAGFTVNRDETLFKVGQNPYDGQIRITSSPSHADLQVITQRVNPERKDQLETEIESLTVTELNARLEANPIDDQQIVESIEKEIRQKIRSEKYATLTEADYEEIPYQPDSMWTTPKNLFLPAGVYTINVSKPGHLPDSFKNIILVKGATIEKNALLEMVGKPTEELRIW